MPIYIIILHMSYGHYWPAKLELHLNKTEQYATYFNY